MFYRLCFISIILICICIYLYVNIESYENLPIKEFLPIPISTQLINEISRILQISSRRITNLIYNGDYTNQQLNVSFTILEPNINEASKNEKNANDSAMIANNLITKNAFNVTIDGINVSLFKINKTTKSKINNIVAIDTYFDNHGLNEISTYAKNKFTSSPNDASLTKFFKLDIDSNYKVNPIILNN